MRTHSKLILAALAATMLLAIAVSAANARSLRVNERNFEIIWNEAQSGKTKLRFIAAGRSPIACKVTLLGSFLENTIKKETTINQNTIRHAELSECTNGTATIKTETLPWNSRYRSFTGTLPVIRSVTIGLIGAAFRIRETGGLTCETSTTAANPGIGIAGNSTPAPETGFERTGEPENLAADRTGRIPLRGEFLCSIAGEGEFEGIGLIRNLPGTAKLRITLI